MLDLKNVTSTRFDLTDIKSSYDFRDITFDERETSSYKNDLAVSVMKELMKGEIAVSRQGITNAANGISTVQVFGSAALSINEDTRQLMVISEQLATGTFGTAQKAFMIKQFEDIVEDINRTANNTKFNGKTLLDATAKDISIEVGYETPLVIEANDLSLDIEYLDLLNDPEEAYNFALNALKNTTSYIAHLSNQAARLEKIISLSELNIENIMSTSYSISSEDLTRELIIEMMSQASTENEILLEAQANVTTDAALYLLGD